MSKDRQPITSLPFRRVARPFPDARDTLTNHRSDIIAQVIFDYAQHYPPEEADRAALNNKAAASQSSKGGLFLGEGYLKRTYRHARLHPRKTFTSFLTRTLNTLYDELASGQTPITDVLDGIPATLIDAAILIEPGYTLDEVTLLLAESIRRSQLSFDQIGATFGHTITQFTQNPQRLFLRQDRGGARILRETIRRTISGEEKEEFEEGLHRLQQKLSKDNRKWN